MPEGEYAEAIKGTSLENVQDAAKVLSALSEDCKDHTRRDYNLTPVVRTAKGLRYANAIPVNACCPASVMLTGYDVFQESMEGVEGFLVREIKPFI